MSDPETTTPESTSSAASTPVPEGTTTARRWANPSGGTIGYVAETGWIALRDDEDEPLADLFSVSYMAENMPRARPVTFVFNGGPGASSAYLHLGALGPRKVSFDDHGRPQAPPSLLTDNAESWLAFTDLVFVDPVGTGWSRLRKSDDAKGGEDKKDAAKPDPKAYFGINKDLDSLTEFMSRWLSAHDRWESPLFVAGESYGGFRAAKLARLCNERGLGLNGTILISPALEFALLDPSDYDVLPWIDLVPTMALAAHHHGRGAHTASTTSSVRASAETFATGALATALIQGAAASEATRTEVTERLADFIGLPVDVVARHGCRVPMATFARELLRDEGKVVGLYDATVSGRDPFPDRDGLPGPDPTLAGIERVFFAGINTCLRTELGVSTDREYHLLSMAVNRDWKVDFDQHALEHQVGASDDLRYGMAMNPHMKVFLTHGLFDLVTPYYSSERIRNLLRLDDDAALSLTTRHFAGGHMFYAWPDSRQRFRDEIASFYLEALSR